MMCPQPHGDDLRPSALQRHDVAPFAMQSLKIEPSLPITQSNINIANSFVIKII